MKIPNRIEVAKRLTEMMNDWKCRVLTDDVACEDVWDEDDETYYLKLTRPHYGQYISFTIGEIYDVATVLTLEPELVKLVCSVQKDNFNNPREQVTICVEKHLIREDLMQEI